MPIHPLNVYDTIPEQMKEMEEQRRSQKKKKLASSS